MKGPSAAPAVSVIIPTRNRVELLPDTLRSVRAAGDDLDIIVVDDASTDATESFCKAQNDVRYVRLSTNSGTASARNTGIRESRAELVAFVDDDDMRLPGSLGQQIKRLRDCPEAALVHGPALIGDSRYSLPTGQLVPEVCAEGDLFWDLIEANVIVTSTVVARKRRLEEAGLFDAKLRTMEDYDLWVRVAENHSIVAVQDPVAIYRSRSSVSGQKTSDRVTHGRDRRALLEKMLKSERARAAPRRARQTACRRHLAIISSSYVIDAAEALLEGNSVISREYLKEAVRLNPLNLRAQVSLMSLFCRTLAERLS